MALAVPVGCESSPPEPASPASPSSASTSTLTSSPTLGVTEQRAIETAKAFLLEQPFANEYVLDSAEARDTASEWQIWFKRTNWRDVKPSRGLVTVHKATGTASWQPLK